MLLHILSNLFLFLYLSVSVKSSALSTAIAPNERLCFYADVDKAGEKLGVRLTYHKITLGEKKLTQRSIVLFCCGQLYSVNYSALSKYKYSGPIGRFI